VIIVGPSWWNNGAIAISGIFESASWACRSVLEFMQPTQDVSFSPTPRWPYRDLPAAILASKLSVKADDNDHVEEDVVAC